MAGNIEERLRELGIELPGAPAPAANYVPFMISGKLVFCAGQLPMWGGDSVTRGASAKTSRSRTVRPRPGCAVSIWSRR